MEGGRKGGREGRRDEGKEGVDMNELKYCLYAQ